MVYTQRGPNNIAVRLGVGDGTFPNVSTYGSGGTTPVELALADFNNDNKLDIAVANLNGGGVGILLGSGNGMFQAAKMISVASPHGLAVGDVNGDGKLDVLVSNTVSAINVLIGDGAGGLTAANPATIPVGSVPYDLALGDLNNDGKLDAVSTNYNDKTLSVRLGNGNGTFSNTSTLNTNTGPLGIAIADVNGDKNLDLVVVNQTAGNASLYLGDGTGVFGNPSTLNLGSGPRQVWVSDLNRDGLLDLAFTNSSSNNISVLLGNGQGSFAGAPSATLFAVGITPFGIVSADLNGDGNRDLVVADSGSSTLSVLLATEQCK